MSLWDWIFFLPTWLNVLIVLGLVLYIYGVWPYKTTSIKYPGPPPSAFMGNLSEMFSKGITELDTENMKKYGEIYLSWVARTPELIISDLDMAREILVKQFPNFVNRPVMKGTISLREVERQQLNLLEDDHWKFVRATLTPAFSSGRLREMVPILDVCLDNLLDVITKAAEEGKSVDFKKLANEC